MAAHPAPSTDPFPTFDEIAQRAYEMFLDRMSSPYIATWLLAETQLLEQAADRVLRSNDRRSRKA